MQDRNNVKDLTKIITSEKQAILNYLFKLLKVYDFLLTSKMYEETLLQDEILKYGEDYEKIEQRNTDIETRKKLKDDYNNLVEKTSELNIAYNIYLNAIMSFDDNYNYETSELAELQMLVYSYHTTVERYKKTLKNLDDEYLAELKKITLVEGNSIDELMANFALKNDNDFHRYLKTSPEYSLISYDNFDPESFVLWRKNKNDVKNTSLFDKVKSRTIAGTYKLGTVLLHTVLDLFYCFNVVTETKASW